MSASYTEEEEYAFLQKIYSSNQYDVELLRIYQQFRDICSDNRLADLAGTAPGTKKRMFMTAEAVIRGYCEHHKVNFDLHLKHLRPIVIIPDESSFYRTFLSLQLVGFDPNRIKAFLDWQMIRYQEDEEAMFFPTVVESKVYEDVKRWSPFDNDRRLGLIMAWLDSVRVFKRVSEKVKNNDTNAKFGWVGDLNLLGKLSEMLFEYELTERVDSFKLAITSQKTCAWKKNIPVLVYLIDRLVGIGRLKVKKRGRFIAAANLFCDQTDTVVKNFEPRTFINLNYEICTRNPHKHRAARATVDQILTELKLSPP